MGKCYRKRKVRERDGGSQYMVLSFVAEDTASQTEDEHRITKQSKHSWAERGENS